MKKTRLHASGDETTGPPGAAAIVAAGLLLAASGPAAAQLPVPNAAGVSTGHVHLMVPDPDRHRQIWTSLGGEIKATGSLEVIEFPGIYLLLAEGEPAAPSTATSANHIGFSVRNFAAYRTTLEEAGAEFFYEDADNGQILADLPDGVRIEILTDAEQAEPIRFHHMHLATEDPEELRDWYVALFSAEAGERRGLPSAVVPGGRVDLLPAQDGAPLGTRGTAIDHIGFEVADLDVFAAHAAELGVAFDLEPRSVPAIGLAIAFITDPAGTRIEITEGLDAIE